MIDIVVTLSGVLGDIFCIIVFSIKFIKSNFNHLVLSMAVFELLYISTAAALFSVPHILPR